MFFAIFTMCMCMCVWVSEWVGGLLNGGRLNKYNLHIFKVEINECNSKFMVENN